MIWVSSTKKLQDKESLEELQLGYTLSSAKTLIKYIKSIWNGSNIQDRAKVQHQIVFNSFSIDAQYEKM